MRILPALLSTFLLLISSANSHPGGKPDPAAALLKPYRDAVRELMDPWEDDQDANELNMAAAKLADEHVLQLADKLHALAGEKLKEQAQRKYDLETYEQRFEAESSIFDLLNSAETGELGGMLVFQLWNPLAAAQQFRTQALVGELGVSKVGLLFMRENIAPPEIFVVSGDSKQPVIAIESGKELTIAKLKYDKTGFYALKSIRFLTKKNQ